MSVLTAVGPRQTSKSSQVCCALVIPARYRSTPSTGTRCAERSTVAPEAQTPSTQRSEQAVTCASSPSAALPTAEIPMLTCPGSPVTTSTPTSHCTTSRGSRSAIAAGSPIAVSSRCSPTITCSVGVARVRVSAVAGTPRPHPSPAARHTASSRAPRVATALAEPAACASASVSPFALVSPFSPASPRSTWPPPRPGPRGQNAQVTSSDAPSAKPPSTKGFDRPTTK